MTPSPTAQKFSYRERPLARVKCENLLPPHHSMEAFQRILDFSSIELDTSFFRFIDLFAGIGGIRYAFESIGGKCVFSSEWDSYAQKTYVGNFINHHAIHGDITEIDATIENGDGRFHQL